MLKKNVKYNPELAKVQQRFHEFYKQNLQSIYTDLETVRHESLHILWRNVLIIVAVCVAFAAAVRSDFLSEYVFKQQWFGMVITIVLIVFGCMIYYPFQRYNEKTKSRTMNKILSFWGDFNYFNGRDIIGSSAIKKSELFSYFNQSSSKDAFRGQHKNAELNVSEHDLRIKGRKGDTIIFKGVMIQLGFPDKFAGKTVVLSKGRNFNFLWNNPLITILIPLFLAPFATVFYHYFTEPDVPLGLLFTILPPLSVLLIWWLIYRIYRHFHPQRATQKVALEGLPFMHRWKVLTDNQIEARYILTPLFMEKMLAIKRLFHGKHLDFSYFDNKLLIAVHTRKNMFETTSLFLPALSYHKVREVVQQLYSIFAVIDTILNKDY